MQQNSSEKEIVLFFQSAGDQLAQESEVLGAVIRNILADNRKVTNKAIILYLIAEMENTSDVVQLDVLRSTLEIVVGRTPDDA
ncbi:biofilm/acid-resistance regulator YmgB/AriR [Siccibacter turicensis]|uniref:Transcriptional regulator n=1 Tax=Siccibacter turicensis TaxID=357233 RepID=A0A2P8VG10_9ENTR|nr:biofilm/acid-resistance regulator YmgB/AriR [Siccibacter turicensis]MDY0970980.1 biofilm/acid-resistance regulator YmgB/AriR [Siccibacter turicensis]PSN06481.1 transcriptional regulator [Siccibacter turicensis]